MTVKFVRVIRSTKFKLSCFRSPTGIPTDGLLTSFFCHEFFFYWYEDIRNISDNGSYTVLPLIPADIIACLPANSSQLKKNANYFHFRLEGDSYSHFKAMLISLSLHLILLMFELLACDRLTSGRHLWVLVFIPLIFGSVSSVGACIWSVKHDRSFELELFLAVNALQFVFLPLKLDGFVSWSWEVVFVPLWIVLCLSLVG